MTTIYYVYDMQEHGVSPIERGAYKSYASAVAAFLERIVADDIPSEFKDVDMKNVTADEVKSLLHHFCWNIHKITLHD
jgi:hypothetical protein